MLSAKQSGAGQERWRALHRLFDKDMKLIDYTGKLCDHKAYLDALGRIESRCTRIEYTIVDDDISFVERFSDLVVGKKTKNKWWGTKTGGRGSDVYTLRASAEIFSYLRRFETFCKYDVSEYGGRCELTDFGMNDIAFFDGGELPLLFTTTHEGYIMARDDIFA